MAADPRVVVGSQEVLERSQQSLSGGLYVTSHGFWQTLVGTQASLVSRGKNSVTATRPLEDIRLTASK